MPVVIDSSVKTILWDLDGTLIDSFGIYETMLRDVFPRHGLKPPTTELLAKNFHGSLEDTFNAVLDSDTDQSIIKNVVADFLAVQDGYYAEVESHLFFDALDLVKRAHATGIRQIIVTNRDHVNRLRASPRSIVERTSLKPYIDIVISGDDSEHRKPKPEVLGNIAFSLDPSEILVIGDQFVDAQFADNLQTKAVLVNRTNQAIVHLNKFGSDWKDVTVVSSLNELDIEEKGAKQ